MSRFKQKEVIEVCGFSIVCYRSLLKREREALLKARRDIFDHTKAFLDLSNEMSEALGMDQDQAWKIINNNGITEAGEDIKADILPYLIRLQERLDPDRAQPEYAIAAVEIFLRSRLDPAWIKQVAPDLEADFGLKIDKNQLAAIQKVEFIDYLSDPVRAELIQKLVQLLPEAVFDEILNLLIKEQNQWKEADPETQSVEEEVDSNDPLH